MRFYSRFTANPAELGVRMGRNGRPTEPELPICTRRHLGSAPGHPLKVWVTCSSPVVRSPPSGRRRTVRSLTWALS
jgi:hypothetical protein